eukprot:scaffold40084_cov51-Attheya_sp.AAC.1
MCETVTAAFLFRRGLLLVRQKLVIIGRHTTAGWGHVIGGRADVNVYLYSYAYLIMGAGVWRDQSNNLIRYANQCKERTYVSYCTFTAVQNFKYKSCFTRLCQKDAGNKNPWMQFRLFVEIKKKSSRRRGVVSVRDRWYCTRQAIALYRVA